MSTAFSANPYRTLILLLALVVGGCSSDDDTSSDPCALGRCPDGQVADDAARDARAADVRPFTDLVSRENAESPLPDTSAGTDAAPYLPEDVDVQRAAELIDSGQYTVLDVREPAEFAGGHIAGAINLAWTSGALAQRHAELPSGRGIVVYCRSGSRSERADDFLVEKGFRPVYDMRGGILAWEAAGLPVVQ